MLCHDTLNTAIYESAISTQFLVLKLLQQISKLSSTMKFGTYHLRHLELLLLAVINVPCVDMYTVPCVNSSTDSASRYLDLFVV